MCCRVDVKPVPETLAALCEIGQFLPGSSGWQRRFPEEGTTVTIRRAADHVELNLSPSVTGLTGHTGHRLAASAMFEMAVRMAEKVAGTIEQHATVAACLEGRGQRITIAQYPSLPLKYENVCPGFQRVFLGPNE